jgi:hypothetical protein
MGISSSGPEVSTIRDEAPRVTIEVDRDAVAVEGYRRGSQ